MNINISFGCGRLNPHLSNQHNYGLIEKAWSCGVRRYDVAPSYGFGCAENILAAGLTEIEANGVHITTKFGVARPKLNINRLYIGDVLKSRLAVILPRALKRGYKYKDSSQELVSTLRNKIDASLIRDGLLISKNNLKPFSIECLLLHEPTSDTSSMVVEALNSLVLANDILYFGVGTGGQIVPPGIGRVIQIGYKEKLTLGDILNYSDVRFHGLFGGSCISSVKNRLKHAKKICKEAGGESLTIIFSTSSKKSVSDNVKIIEDTIC